MSLAEESYSPSGKWVSTDMSLENYFSNASGGSFSTAKQTLENPNLVLVTRGTGTANITYGPALETYLLNQIAMSGPADEKHRFSDLGPLERIAFMARHDRWELTLWGVGLLGALYTICSAIAHLYPEIASIFSMQAMAATGTNAIAPAAVPSGFVGHDTFDWFVGCLMALTLIAGLCMSTFSRNPDQVVHGRDLTKLIIGFVIGFLSGGRHT